MSGESVAEARRLFRESLPLNHPRERLARYAATLAAIEQTIPRALPWQRALSTASWLLREAEKARGWRGKRYPEAEKREALPEVRGAFDRVARLANELAAALDAVPEHDPGLVAWSCATVWSREPTRKPEDLAADLRDLAGKLPKASEVACVGLDRLRQGPIMWEGSILGRTQLPNLPTQLALVAVQILRARTSGARLHPGQPLLSAGKPCWPVVSTLVADALDLAAFDAKKAVEAFARRNPAAGLLDFPAPPTLRRTGAVKA